MFFLTHSAYALPLITFVGIVTLVASVLLGEIKHFTTTLTVIGAGGIIFFLLTLWGKDVPANLVPWFILAFILVRVFPPMITALQGLHWLESEEERNIRISQENAAQYSDLT